MQTPDSNAPLGRSKPLLAVCLVLVLLVWSVFGQTLHQGFLRLDDEKSVYNNPVINQGLTWHGIVQVFSRIDPATHDWWPLNEVSHMLDCQFYGLHPAGHHLTNVLLHMGVAILLFLVLQEMTGTLWPGAFVAAMFAVHPLRVESVAWVSERKDVLSGLFFLLTLWAYVRYARKQGAGGRAQGTGNYCLALVFFICGLLSKSMLVPLPFVLLLLDYWPLRRGSNVRRLLLEKIPFLLLSLGAGVTTVLAQSQTNLGSIQGVSLTGKVAAALTGYVGYLGHTFYPVGLAMYYPPLGNHPGVGKTILVLTILMVITGGVIAGRRQRPYLFTGWFWYVLMLAPVAGIQSGLNDLADRYTYLPQIGLFIMLAWGGAEWCGSRRYRRVILGLGSGLAIAGLMVMACVQTGYWQDDIILWEHAVACRPDNFAAQNNLGVVLAGQHHWEQAFQHYQRAVEINPDYASAQGNLGKALAREGKMKEAVPHLERALQLVPDYTEVRETLGIVLAAEGKMDEAEEQYRQALQIEPDEASIHYCYASILAGEGKLDAAIEQYRQALQLEPGDANTHYELGNALASQGKLPDAIQQFALAVQYKPDYAEAHVGWGDALASQGNLPEAALHFQQALNLAKTQNNSPLAGAVQVRLDDCQSQLRPHQP
jgi:tetratricopeptide (TPR) repeat protein